MSWIARAIIVAVVGGLLAWQVVRTAIMADPTTRRTIAPRAWPSHPTLLINRMMSEIGAHAARGQTPPPPTLRRLDEITRKAPLAEEPFLIKGALAQIRQQQQLAERLFAAARTRNPRAPAARYFLADRYLRTGRVAQALTEIAALSRLFPDARAQFAPALAAFARMPGAVPQLRSFFRTSPELEAPVLSQLAEDARNADLILALWGRRSGEAEAAAPDWQSKLINRLIDQGQVAKAYSTWQLVAGVNRGPGTIFNPGFRKMAAPPPFNWKLSSEGGVVEPGAGQRLQVIYYGRDDAVFAEQLLLLAPGRYQLSMEISGPLGTGGAIAWTLTCVPRADSIFRLPIDRKGRLAGTFSVPQGCPAQRLQLIAQPGEFPQSQEFTVGRLSLTRGPAE